MTGPEQVRASDADRERTVSFLRDAVADGRLGPEEFQQRIDLAYRARTFGELAPLTDDLVLPPAAPLPPPPQWAVAPWAPQPVRRSTDGLSITSLVLALVSFFPFFGIVTAPLAVIFGISGMVSTSKSKAPGRGMAIAGLSIGSVEVIIGLIIIIAIANSG